MEFGLFIFSLFLFTAFAEYLKQYLIFCGYALGFSLLISYLLIFTILFGIVYMIALCEREGVSGIGRSK